MSQPPRIRPLSSGFSYRVGPQPAPAAQPGAAPPGPRPPQSVMDAIGERIAARDMPGAFAAAEAALAEGYEHPTLLNLSAGRLEAEGKPGEALIRLQRARHLAPGDPGVVNALGLCLLALEAPAEAESVFRDLITLVPDFAPAHANLGQALAASGRLDRAGVAYRRALEIDPDQIIALAGLAVIAARRGAFAEAESLADRVLARAPDAADALMAKAEQLNPDILFVDGVYLMIDQVTGESNTPQALTNITRGLKRVAQKLNIPIVISTQTLLWKMKGGKVSADSIGYSSSFFQDSDVILGLEPVEEDDEIRLLKVVQARNCPPSETSITWRWDTGCFHDESKQDDCKFCARPFGR